MSRRAALSLAKRALPPLLGVVGLFAIGALVKSAGAVEIGATLLDAWPWLFGIVLLEAGAAAVEASAVCTLLGDRAAAVPTHGWVRSSGLAVACALLLPGGRVLGEVVRATALGRWVDGAEAAALVLRVHGTYLLTISLASLLCLAAACAAPEPSSLLVGLLLYGTCFNLGLGTLFLAGPRRARVGRFLARRVGLLADFGPRFDDAFRKSSFLDPRAYLRLVGARALHAASSATALVAILGVAGASPARILVSEGIQLVASHAGDTVPGQVGVLEGAYRLFAGMLGLGEALGLALSIALLFRIARVVLALVASALSALLRERSASGAAALAASALLASSALLTAPADAQSATVVVRQRVVGVITPMGAEHAIGVGMHVPLSRSGNPLFEGTHLELGARTYTSPVYSQTGAYLQVSPLAFLILRAEAGGKALWSIGMDGAGFYPVGGYDADVRSRNLPAAAGRVASGLNAQMSAILQGAFSVGAWRPIFWNQLVVEYERLGAEDYHYSPKYDLVLARSEWMIANTAMVLLERSFGDRLALRAGGYDDLRYVLASGARSHQLGLTAMVAIGSGGWLRELLIFARAGVLLAPERRADQATGLVGLIARYDVGEL